MFPLMMASFPASWGCGFLSFRNYSYFSKKFRKLLDCHIKAQFRACTSESVLSGKFSSENDSGPNAMAAYKFKTLDDILRYAPLRRRPSRKSDRKSTRLNSSH